MTPDERLEICKECEHLRRIPILPGDTKILQCNICNCFMHVKTKLPNAVCPDNPPRWN